MEKIREWHGMTNTKIYKAWSSMKQRCYNPKQQSYKHYGGRGIKVQQEFLNSFVLFYNCVSSLESFDIALINKGLLTLDRIDVNGDYEEGNLRWATNSLQQKNRRRRKDNSTGFVGVGYIKRRNRYMAYVTINGKLRYLGYSYKTAKCANDARLEFIKDNNVLI